MGTVAPGSDFEILIRRRDGEIPEKHVGEHRIVMLAGVHDNVLNLVIPKVCCNRRKLHELRAGSDNT